MKIWQLKIKNLGPFHVKPVELDFREILADASLVAITGRTGAGKTMLFDAVCVALYGKTPRLDGNGDKNPRHLLSHNKSDGHAEVIFETNGIRYLAEWRVKGTTQSKKLLEVGSEKPLAEGTAVNKKIESILGLDFDAFRRSIMLAQGDFAAFLKAPPKKKLHILEATASIGIYNDLQGALNDKMNEVRAKKDEVKSKLDALPKASHEQVSAAEKTLRYLEEKARDLAKQRLGALIGIAKREVLKLEGHLAKLDASLAVQTQVCKRADAEVGRLEAERELAVLADSINELRQRLEPGEPCLVCGATEHPGADGVGIGTDERLEIVDKALAAARTKAREEQEKRDSLVREQIRLKANKTYVIHQIDTYLSEIRRLNGETEATQARWEELGQIRAKLKEIEKAIEDAQQHIGAQRKTIKDLKKALADRETLEEAFRKASDECTRWNKLRLAIASPRPGALGKFALRVVLEQVSQFANAQLEYLTSGRYQLKVESIDKLSVIDRWNANEERPVETLSGGESFLTSFALALGLSEISRGRAEIGSLFLDEGFGTLDAETLDIVIDALERLRLQGRSIFLISHIERLTRHLPVEIRVRKRRNAGSTVDVG